MQLHPDEHGRLVLRLVQAVTHTFSAAELNYTTPEQELAALREGCRRLPHLMVGRTVVWLTDNTAVADLLASARVSKRKRLRTTWADLQGVRIISVHVSGALNVLADALSRNPALHELPSYHEEAPLELLAMSLKAPTVTIAAFRPAFKAQSELTTAARAHALDRVRRLAPEALALAAELQLTDESLEPAMEAAATGASWRGLLFEQVADGELRVLLAHAPRAPTDPWASQRRMVLVVPRGLRAPVLETMHAATAHGGQQRFEKALRSAFWWPTLAADALAFRAACDACRRADRATINGTVGDSESDPLLKPERPGDVWEADTYEWTLPTGLRLVISGAICKYTGLAVLVRLADKTAVASTALLRRIHDGYGPFRGMHHDGGPEFYGEFEATAKRLGVLQTRGTPRNSNSQARIERLFRSLNDLFTRVMTHNPGARLSPDDLVSAATQALNSAWSAPVPGAPSSTPFARFFGRPQPFSLMLTRPVLPGPSPQADLAHFVVAWANEATVASGPPLPPDSQARVARRAAQVAASRRAAATAHGPPPPIRAGDLVFLVAHSPPMGKIAAKVRSRLGPFRVLELLPPEAPLRARLSLLGDTTEELTVFLREVQPCGDALSIDDPVLRTLPPSGYFVSELVDSDEPEVLAKLQAIIDQGLAPEQRAQLDRERAAIRRREEAVDRQRPTLADPEEDDEDSVVLDAAEVINQQEEEDDDDDDDDDKMEDSDSEVEDEPPSAEEGQPQGGAEPKRNPPRAARGLKPARLR
jgi:hypothetical protein